MTENKPLLGSMADSQSMIEGLQQQVLKLQHEIEERQQQLNDLQGQIQAWNAVRQAHGFPMV